MADLRIERVVVTGSRKFTDRKRIEADLRALLPLGLRRVAQGGNGLDEQLGGDEPPAVLRSADTLAALAAAGLQLDGATYRVNRAPDDRGTWTGEDGHDRRAPLRRNVRMLDVEKPDLVLAYPGKDSRGTWHCVAEAWRRRIPVLVWVSWLTGGEATRFVQRKVEERGVSLVERGVSLVRHRQGLLEDLALFDRDGHRVIITKRRCEQLPAGELLEQRLVGGSEQFVDQRPEDLDG